MFWRIKDYYRLLGIAPSAGLEEIQAAYRQLARTYHPDVNRSAEASRMMQEINEAYAILRDPVRRARYDQARLRGIVPTPVVMAHPGPGRLQVRIWKVARIFGCCLLVLGVAAVLFRWYPWLLPHKFQAGAPAASPPSPAPATEFVALPEPTPDVAPSTPNPQEELSRVRPPADQNLSAALPTQSAITTGTDLPRIETTVRAVVTRTEEPQPTGPAMAISHQYEPGDRWEIRIQKVLLTDQLTSRSSSQTVRATWRFAIVFLAVTNRGPGTDYFVVQSDTLKIQDAYGRTYEVNELATAYAQEQYQTDPGLFVNPGQTVSMVGVWELSPHGDEYRLVPGGLVEPGRDSLRLDIP